MNSLISQNEDEDRLLDDVEHAEDDFEAGYDDGEFDDVELEELFAAKLDDEIDPRTIYMPPGKMYFADLFLR